MRVPEPSTARDGRQRVVRLRRIAAILLLLSVLPMAGDNSPAVWERTYQSAQAQLDSGEFEAELPSVRREYERWRTRPDSQWHWPFRLQLAESLLELNRVDEARPLLGAAPAPPDLESRRLALCAYLECRLRHYPEARGYLDRAAAPAGTRLP